ncbi:MAG TPA: nucleotidyltransferase family protein [Candidatus Binatia bacterium]|jgi:molybdenum cofactor cytidylyltransferase|nr:nucleotidyltransferase family protein [Candidatus Binatia bacterium]
MISAVVLAAGRAQRLGQEKLLLPLRGKPLLQWVLESALASDLDEIVCVTRELASARRQLNLSDERLFWLTNYAADRGQSTSVISGLWATNPKSEGVMFLVGDQPLIRKELINSLIEKFSTGSAWIVAPSFNREPRNPVLFRRNLFRELLQLSGDRGGRVLIEKHRNKTALVEWKDEIPFLDIDVHEDYERLKEMAYADD